MRKSVPGEASTAVTGFQNQKHHLIEFSS